MWTREKKSVPNKRKAYRRRSVRFLQSLSVWAAQTINDK